MPNNDKQTMGYTTAGYIIQSQSVNESDSSNSTVQAANNEISGLKIVGNIILDTWEYQSKLDKFGPIIIRSKNSISFVPDSARSKIDTIFSDTNKKPIPQNIEIIKGYATNDCKCIFGCSIPSYIIKDYCATIFKDTDFADGDCFRKLAQAGLLGAQIKVQMSTNLRIKF